MNDYSETIATGGDYRVLIVNDPYAEPPDWDGQGTITQLDYRGAYGWRSEVIHADHGGMRAAIHYGDILAEAWTHYSDFAKRGNREAMVKRYLRIFHGVVGFDYFDTRDGKYVCIVTEADLREWGFDTVADFHTANPDHDNPASQVLVAWQAWVDGEVYGWRIEQRVVIETTIRRPDNTYTTTERQDWDEVESVWGFYGDTDAREQATEAFNDYLSREDVPA